MEIIEKLILCSSRIVQGRDEITYYIRPRIGDTSERTLVLPLKNEQKSESPVSTPETPQREIRREGYYESDICEGLYIHQCRCDVEYEPASL